MKKRIILAVVLTISLVAAWLLIDFKKEKVSLNFGDANSKYRKAEPKNLSPYSIFGDSSLVLLTEAEGKAISYLKVANSDVKSNIGSIVFELSSGMVRFYDRSDNSLHSTLLEPNSLAIFLSVDPSTHKFSNYSPYHYAGDNPVKNIDPDGREFTEAAQKWVTKYLDKITERHDSNLASISEMQGKIEAGDLSKRQTKSYNKRISKLKENNAEFDAIKGEVITLSNSTQIYDVQESRGLNTADSKRAGTGFDFTTGHVVIFMPDDDMKLFSHELKHAFQFETGSYSIGPRMGNVPYTNLLYDKHDELEGFKRGELFGGDRYRTIGSLPSEYANVAEGPYDSGNIPEMKSASSTSDPNKAYQNLANQTGHAFRINGSTFFKKKQ
jgi:hypothetical protein